jgi:hypothetical protein
VQGFAAVRLGVLPLDQGDLDSVARRSIADGCIDRCRVGPTDAKSVCTFAEVVVQPDPLEDDMVAAVVERQYLGDVEAGVAQDTAETGGVLDERAQRVEALDLTRAQVRRGSLIGAAVPADLVALEPVQHDVPHLWEEV